jgi:hypothetical protein
MPCRPLLVLALLGASAVPAAIAQARAGNDADKESFLLEAEVVRARSAPGGVTGSIRATLRRGGTTHDADIQVIDESSPERSLGGTTELDFRDSWRNNVAAYRIDRLLGLRMVPVTVIRDYHTKRAAYTWWLDELLMTERDRSEKKQAVPDVDAWNQQVHAVRVFDQLIFNFDRNLGNLLIDRAWRLWMIDHTRAFKIFKDLRNEKELPETCPRALLAGLRKLDEPTLKTRTGGLLNKGQMEGVLGRRDRIVAHFDKLIAARGASNVLYALPARP